jgi:hypothetical protein
VQQYNDRAITEFRRNGGIVGGDLAGQTALLLTTIGARTGQARTLLRHSSGFTSNSAARPR